MKSRGGSGGGTRLLPPLSVLRHCVSFLAVVYTEMGSRQKLEQTGGSQACFMWFLFFIALTVYPWHTPCVFLCPEWEGMWLTSSQYVKGKGNLQMYVRLQSVDFYLSKVIYTDLPSVGLDSLGKKPLNTGLGPSWDERLSSRAWWSKQLCWRSPCGEDVWSASTIWGQLPANSQQKAGSSMIRFSPSQYWHLYCKLRLWAEHPDEPRWDSGPPATASSYLCCVKMKNSWQLVQINFRTAVWTLL